MVSLKEFRAALLVVQAYGPESLLWGSPHDWKRSLINEDRSREYSLFWRGSEWLGSGTVERVRLIHRMNRVKKRKLLQHRRLQDFEPSMDALIEANITGPNG